MFSKWGINRVIGANGMTRYEGWITTDDYETDDYKKRLQQTPGQAAGALLAARQAKTLITDSTEQAVAMIISFWLDLVPMETGKQLLCARGQLMAEMVKVWQTRSQLNIMVERLTGFAERWTRLVSAIDAKDGEILRLRHEFKRFMEGSQPLLREYGRGQSELDLDLTLLYPVGYPETPDPLTSGYRDDIPDNDNDNEGEDSNDNANAND